MEHECPVSMIADLSRWQRIQLVRDLSTAAAGEEETGELGVIGSRYARVSKPGYEEQNKARRIQAGQIFERQVTPPPPAPHPLLTVLPLQYHLTYYGRALDHQARDRRFKT
jgi:hypothetical protein